MISINKHSGIVLPLSMIIGAMGFSVFRHFMFMLPPGLFLMLFFTFCKVDPLDLRLRLWHWVVLIAQVTLAIATYYTLLYFTDNVILAQGVMVCFIMPTATAGPIIAGKLGGSVQNLTSFTLLSNFATALIIPTFFTLINPQSDMSFQMAAWILTKHVSAVLLGPFICAWVLRLVYNAIAKYKCNKRRFQLSPTLAQLPFWIWAWNLVILMANMTYTLVNGEYDWHTVVWLCLGAFVSCMLQFWLGKYIGLRFPAGSHGHDYNDILINPETAPTDMPHISRITAGQAFGQKNTTLGVWLAQAYLNPIASLGPAIYIIWQNLFNSWQMERAAKGKPY